MKTLSLRWFLLLTALLATGALLPAQTDQTPSVPVRLSGGGTVTDIPGTGTLQFSISGFPGAGGGDRTMLGEKASVPAGDNTFVVFDSVTGESQSTVQLEPGKLYTVFAEGMNVTAYDFQLVAPPGYQIEIDGLLRNIFRRDNAGEFFNDPISVRLLPLAADFFGRAGAATSLANGRLFWQVALGALANGGSAGNLTLVDAALSAGTSPWAALFTPAALHYESLSTEVAVIRQANLLRQIIAPEAVVDIVTLNPTAFDLRFYAPAQATGTGSDLRTFTGDPYVTYTVAQADAATTPTKLRITSTTRHLATGALARTAATTLERSGTWPNFQWTMQDWHDDPGPALAESFRSSSSPVAGTRTETEEIRVPGGAPATRTTRTFVLKPWGEVLTAETRGTTAPVTTDFTYHENAAEAGSYGWIRTVATNAGPWEAFDYFPASAGSNRLGTIQRRYRPFGNSPATPTLDPLQGEVMTFDYAPDPFGFLSRVTLAETRINGTLTGRATTAYAEQLLTLGTVSFNLVTATRTDSASATDPLITTTRYFREDTADAFFRSQLHSVTAPDGVKTAYVYQRGTWDGTTFTKSDAAGTAPGSASRVSILTGTSGSSYPTHDGYDLDDLTLVAGKSTLEVTLRDARARVVRTESHAWNGTAWALVAAVNYTYDAAGLLLSRAASNGATATATYVGELKTTETDEAGVQVTTTHDAAGRVQTATKTGGPRTAFTYDAEDRATAEATTDTSGAGETLLLTRAFDDAGRLASETPPGLGATTFTYSPATRQRTLTLPGDGATRTETYLADGRLEKIEGTAVVPEYYTYALESDQETTTVRSGTPASARWQKTRTDWLGRPVRSERPGFAPTAQPNFVAEQFYAAGTGRLSRTTATGSAATLFAYDALGRVTRTGLDVDASGTLAEASTDRITDTDQLFEFFESAWWLRSETKTYATANNATATTLGLTRQRLTGHPAGILGETRVTDAEGNTTTRTIAVNPATQTVTLTTTRSGFATPQVETIVNGLPTTTATHDGLTFTTTYDALSRPGTSLDSRGNPTTTTYQPGTTLVATVRDALNATTTQTYDPRGRLLTRTLPAPAAGLPAPVTRFAYNLRGQLTQQWGDGTYPVQYGYDATLGDRLTQSTYRSAPAADSPTWPAVGAADTTTFTTDAATGLLHKKTDPAGQFVEFTYNARGQTAQRLWARTTGGSRVSTTYAYDDATGEPTGITYNDGTPAVAYTYTRLGQLATAADFTGTRTLAYDPAKPWRLATAALPAFYGSRVLTALYETTGLVGRSRGLQLGATAGSASDLEQTYGFTSGGRLASITSALAPSLALPARTFTYGYLANTALLGSLAVSGGHPFTVTRTYESARDVLTSIDAKWSTTSVTRYDYTTNALYQRATAKQTGSAYADYGDATYHRYSYNPRGELTTAPGYLGADPALTTQPLPGRQHAYAFDSLGNRQWADRTGDPAQREDYTTNALNQITTKENLTVPVQGTVDAAAPTTKTAVAGAASTGRQGRYFGAEASVANATAPWAGVLQAYVAKIGGGAGGADLIRTEVRAAQLAQALQSFTYDLDGNLLSDGLWDYQWDAENRLIRQATTTLAAGAGFPNKVLEFRYDHLGRRVQKVVQEWSGSQWTVVSARRFLYSGWDLLAEFSSSDLQSFSLLRSYTWGLDLVGSLSASGGVGALLQIRDEAQNKTFLPTFDANGNVASLLNADTGTLEAAYEYDPFGQLLRAEGAYAKENPFRFSTKFQDEETGLIYYGYRYYSAALGRFLNRDPIAEAGGLNLYAFAGNDAVNGYDYLGLDGDDIVEAADGGSGGIYFPRINFGSLSFVVRPHGGPVKPKPPQAAPPSSLDRERLEPRKESPTDARTVLDGPANEMTVEFRIRDASARISLREQIADIFAQVDRQFAENEREFALRILLARLVLIERLRTGPNSAGSTQADGGVAGDAVLAASALAITLTQQQIITTLFPSSGLAQIELLAQEIAAGRAFVTELESINSIRLLSAAEQISASLAANSARLATIADATFTARGAITIFGLTGITGAGSTLPAVVIAPIGAGAFIIGYGVGTLIDRTFHVSDRIADFIVIQFYEPIPISITPRNNPRPRPRRDSRTRRRESRAMMDKDEVVGINAFQQWLERKLFYRSLPILSCMFLLIPTTLGASVWFSFVWSDHARLAGLFGGVFGVLFGLALWIAVRIVVLSVAFRIWRQKTSGPSNLTFSLSSLSNPLTRPDYPGNITSRSDHGSKGSKEGVKP